MSTRRSARQTPNGDEAEQCTQWLESQTMLSRTLIALNISRAHRLVVLPPPTPHDSAAAAAAPAHLQRPPIVFSCRFL
jgi:hypothetical protein